MSTALGLVPGNDLIFPTAATSGRQPYLSVDNVDRIKMISMPRKLITSMLTLLLWFSLSGCYFTYMVSSERMVRVTTKTDAVNIIKCFYTSDSILIINCAGTISNRRGTFNLLLPVKDLSPVMETPLYKVSELKRYTGCRQDFGRIHVSDTYLTVVIQRKSIRKSESYSQMRVVPHFSQKANLGHCLADSILQKAMINDSTFIGVILKSSQLLRFDYYYVSRSNELKYVHFIFEYDKKKRYGPLVGYSLLTPFALALDIVTFPFQAVWVIAHLDDFYIWGP